MTTRPRRFGIALVYLLAAGCADHVGDDLRRGAASLPPAIEAEIIAAGTTTSTVPPAPVEPRTLEVGGCMDDAPTPDGAVPATVDAIVAGGAVIPRSCAEEHRYEVYAHIELGGAGAPWPGAESIAEDADRACTASFESFVGRDWADSALDHLALVPDEAGWAAGERHGSCILFDLGLVPLEGTMEGSGR